jgi:signal transduction histidine kinase
VPGPRGPGTLRGRLALIALATATVWVVGLTATFNLVLDSQLRQQADQQLRARAGAVSATVDSSARGTVTVREVPDDAALDSGVWIYQGTRSLERPGAGVASQRAADSLAGGRERFATVGGQGVWRLYALPLVQHGRTVGTIVTQTSLDAYTFTGRAALAGSTALAIMLLGCVYLVARMIVGRALRPVGAMSVTAAHRSRQGTAERFGTAGRPAELAELGANLDKLLDDTAAILRHEQQLTAELSHELRTPLARIYAETEWLTARPRSDSEQLDSHRAIAEAAARMQEICRTLLSEARSGAVAEPGRCEVGGVLEKLARRGREEYPDAPPITVRGPGGAVGVPAPLLERILTPLLDNARRYAVSQVVLEYAAGSDGVRIAVADDGPGVPAALAEEVFRPGRRADAGDGHDGAGLGLPLARRLARAAAGDVTLDGSGPGARFVVRLPAA